MPKPCIFVNSIHGPLFLDIYSQYYTEISRRCKQISRPAQTVMVFGVAGGLVQVTIDYTLTLNGTVFKEQANFKIHSTRINLKVAQTPLFCGIIG